MALSIEKKEHESKKIVRNFLVGVFMLTILSIFFYIVLLLFINHDIAFILFMIVVLSIGFYLSWRLVEAAKEWDKN